MGPASEIIAREGTNKLYISSSSQKHLYATVDVPPGIDLQETPQAVFKLKRKQSLDMTFKDEKQRENHSKSKRRTK